MGTKKAIVAFLRQAKTGQRGLLLGICVSLLSVEIYLCFDKYFQFPTYISSFITDQRQSEFPEITLCPDNDGYKLDVLQKYGIKSTDDYKGKTNHTWDAPGITPKDLFVEATYSLNDLIESFYIRAISDDGNGKVSFNDPLHSDHNDFLIWKEQRHRTFGRCYSAYPAPQLKQQQIYYEKIKFVVPVKLYLHHQGQFLDFSGRMGLRVQLGTKVQIQVSWQEMVMMEKSGESGFQCSGEGQYDSCMYTAITQAMLGVTDSSCIVPWLPGQHKVCSTEKEKNASFWEHYQRITNQAGDCPSSCRFLLVTAGGRNVEDTVEEDKGQVYFYFQSRTQRSEEAPLYTTLSLFGEIGGYVGLLLGFSIFQLNSVFGSLIDFKIKSFED